MANAEKEKRRLVVKSLLKKMDASPGFAGLGGGVKTIARLIDNYGSNREIVAAVLRDPALSAKLLQIANSRAHARGAGNVATIDQVLAILGLNSVKSVALSLLLLDSPSRTAQSNQLHAEIVAAFFTGNLAAEITRSYGANYSDQETQVCGLLQNLGRMMSLFYLYEDFERIRKLHTDKNLAENEAVKQTLGVSFEEIGVAIAHHWALPEVLQISLAPDTVAAPPEAAANALSWHQLCSLFCRRITATLFRLPENRAKIEIPKCIDFFQRALRLNGNEVLELIKRCLRETDTVLASMNFPGNLEDARHLLQKASERATDRLSAKDTLLQKEQGQTPIDAVKHLMRLIHDHCGFDCTLVCLPSGSSGLVAIAGIGRNAGMLTTKFRSGSVHKDIFQVIMEHRKDAFIADVNLAKYARLIPRWYHEFVKAKSFVVLPLVNEGKLLGIIYGDYSKQQHSTPSALADGVLLEWRSKLLQTLKHGPQVQH